MLKRDFFNPIKIDGKVRCKNCPLFPDVPGNVVVTCGAGFTSHLLSRRRINGAYRPMYWYSDNCKLVSLTLTVEREKDEEVKSAGTPK